MKLRKLLVVAAVLASGTACAGTLVPVTGTELLDWCFTMGSLSFGVFGFLYGVFATIRLGDKGHLRIVDILVKFCGLIALFLIIISLLSFYIAIAGQVRWEVYVLIACLFGFSAFTGYLAKTMRTGV